MSIHAAFTKASPDFGRTSAPKVARLPGIDGDTARATESLLASLWSAQRRKEGWIHPDAIPALLAREPWLTAGQIGERLEVSGSAVSAKMQKLQRDKVTQNRRSTKNKAKFEWALVVQQ